MAKSTSSKYLLTALLILLSGMAISLSVGAIFALADSLDYCPLPLSQAQNQLAEPVKMVSPTPTLAPSATVQDSLTIEQTEAPNIQQRQEEDYPNSFEEFIQTPIITVTVRSPPVPTSERTALPPMLPPFLITPGGA